MKRILLLAGLVVCLGVSPAWAQEEAAVFNSKGMLHFEKGEYEKALGFFEKAKNFHWLGLTHIRLKQFDQASKYLEKLLKKNPNDTEAYFDYGMSLFQEGRFQDARPWLEKTIEQFPGSEQANYSQEWLNQIKEGTVTVKKSAPVKRWALGGSASFYYDSNVTRDPLDQRLGGFADEDDYLAAGTLDFRYLLLNKNPIHLYFNYDGYQSAYLNTNFDSNRFNYGRHNGGVELVYKINDFIQWRLPSSYSFSFLGKAKYLQSITAETILDMAHMEHWLFSVTAGFRRDEFFQNLAAAAQNRDASQPYVRAEQYFFAPHNRDVYFKAGYGFERNEASGNDWDFTAHHALYAIHFPIGWKVNFLMLGDVVVRRNFDNTDSVFNVKRTDKSFYNTAVFSREILPYLNVGVTYSFFVRESIARYRYRRHVTGLTLSTKL